MRVVCCRVRNAVAVLAAFAVVLSASAAKHTVTLEWDPNPETDLAGYMVFWGEDSGNYTHATNVVGATRVTLPGFDPGVTNYFAVLAYNVHNQAGELSDEVAYAVPPEETLPAIAPIADQVTAEDEPLRVGFMLVGGQVAPDLEIWATTSDPLLISPSRVGFTGTGRAREAILTPVRHRSGVARITLHVSDGRATNSAPFSLLVAPVNDPPIISNIRDIVLLPGRSRTVGFFVADAETPGPELLVTAATSDPGLIPVEQILLQNDGNDRSITLSPVAGAYGTAEITLQVTDGPEVTSRSFRLTVLAPPVLAPLPDHLIDEDEVLTIPLEISDGDTPLAALTLSAESSNLGLIPPSSIEFTGTDSNRFLVITPWPNRHGNAEIAVTVSDGELSHTEVIALTVRPVNDPPFISVIADQAGTIGQPHAVGFLVSDVESPAAGLQVSAMSSDADLIPPRTIEVTGHGNSRTLQFSPAPGRSGSALMRIEVGDGELTTTREFVVTVLPGQDGPYIPPISEQVLLEDAIQVVSFEIQDPDTPLSAIRLWVGSSRPSLIHPDSISLEGEGASRTATFVPLLNQVGSAILTLFASDGLVTNSRNFTVNVLPVNDPPLLSFVPPQTVVAGASLAVSFSVIDPETPPSNLVVTAISSDSVLLPAGRITLLGTGYERSAVITTLSNQTGLVTIELTVSDGVESMSRSFLLNIEGATPPPGGEPQPLPGEGSAGFASLAGLYRGLFAEPDHLRFASAGSLRLTLSEHGHFTGSVLLAGQRHNFIGRFNVDRMTSVFIPRGADQAPLVLTLLLNSDPGKPPLIGSVTDGTFEAPLQAERAAVVPGGQSSGLSGRYELLFPFSNGTPMGTGAVEVKADGTLLFNGSLADGTRFSQVSGVSRRGYWPLYSSLDAGRAVLLGWIEFSTPAEQQFWGVLHLAHADSGAEDTMVIPVVGVKVSSP